MKILSLKNAGKFLVILGLLLFFSFWYIVIFTDTENAIIKKTAISIVVIGFFWVYIIEKLHKATSDIENILKCKKCGQSFDPGFRENDFYRIASISFNLPVFCKCPFCKKHSWCKSI